MNNNTYSPNIEYSSRQSNQQSSRRSNQQSSRGSGQQSYGGSGQQSYGGSSQQSYGGSGQQSSGGSGQQSSSRSNRRPSKPRGPQQPPSSVKPEKSAKIKKNEKLFKNFSMKSTWFEEHPPRFCEDYIAVMCPIGKRSLIVAEGGLTTCYRKNGRYTDTFKSAFPGGNLQELKQLSFKTILDCIWDVNTQTVYVLDVIFWRDRSFQDCETTFRFFWIDSIFQRMPELQIVDDEYNNYRFMNIKRGCCDPYALTILLRTHSYKIEGMLFYLKNGKYEAGETKSVTWALAWMAHDLFGVAMPLNSDPKPEGTTTAQQYIQKWIHDRNEKKRSSQRQGRIQPEV